MPLSRQELESTLWQAADILRGQIDAADYKNYIFSILFLKRLSDRFDEEVERRREGSGVPRDAWRSGIATEHEFFVPETARWAALSGASMNLGEALNVASHDIEDANTPRLDGVLSGTNWNDETKLGSPANRERIIRSLLNHFAGLEPAGCQPAGGRGRARATSSVTPTSISSTNSPTTLGRRAGSSTPRARWSGSSSSCFSPARGCASATPRQAPAGCSSTRPSTSASRAAT